MLFSSFLIGTLASSEAVSVKVNGSVDEEAAVETASVDTFNGGNSGAALRVGVTTVPWRPEMVTSRWPIRVGLGALSESASPAAKPAAVATIAANPITITFIGSTVAKFRDDASPNNATKLGA